MKAYSSCDRFNLFFADKHDGMKMKHIYPFSHLGVLLAFLFFPLFCFSQSNWFQFSAPQHFAQQSAFRFVYRIPADSVRSIVLDSRAISPGEAWMDKPAYIVSTASGDSLFNTNLDPGYYYSVTSYRNEIHTQINYKRGFTESFINLRDFHLVTIIDEDPASVSVFEDGRQLAYNAILKGYILNPKDGQEVELRKGNDIKLFKVDKDKNYGRDEWNGYHGSYRQQPQNFLGYVVTNKPIYYPRDTVKYKAYLLYPTAKTLVQEPLKMRLTEYYYHGDEQGFKLSDSIRPMAPGVYYGEFVLGDSVKPDRDYQLVFRGQNNVLDIANRLRVEDYQLDEMRVSVKAEGLRMYHYGDSVHIYVNAFTTNGLPVLDGTVRMVIKPGNVEVKETAQFVADTLIDVTKPAAPSGETYMGFSTTTLPDAGMVLSCNISFTNSSFEKRDTAFTIRLTTMPYYINVEEAGKVFTAKLISNKKSVAGKGFMRKNDKDYPISFPYTDTLRQDYAALTFTTKDTDGTVMETYTYNNRQAALDGYEDYKADTAFLKIVNPTGALLRYAIYKGNIYEGWGVCNTDTMLKVIKTKNKTVTILTNYIWAGQQHANTYKIEKLDKQLFIDLKKRDVIFPGQNDTLTISLTDVDGKPVPKTNMTVLAFNSQFRSDNVPQLSSPNGRHDALEEEVPYNIYYAPRLNYYAAHKSYMVSPAWLKYCGADTMFYYKNILFNPARVAWYLFPVAESMPSQLAVHVHRQGYWLAPEIITVDDIPIVMGVANYTSDRNAMVIAPGRHRVTLRLRDTLYSINDVDVCSGMKTNLFINIENLKALNADSLRPFVNAVSLPDSFTNWEKDMMARCLFFIRNERSEPIYLIQKERQYIIPAQGRYYGYNYSNNTGTLSIAGPIFQNDSVGFFQYDNTKCSIMPEVGNVFIVRPGMLRVEMSQGYNWLNRKITINSYWPEFDKVIDTVYDFRKLSVNREAAGDIQMPDFYSSYKRYKLAVDLRHEHRTQQGNALLRMVNKSNRSIRQVFVYNTADASIPELYTNLNSVSDIWLPAGKYHIYIVWHDSMAAIIENVDVRSGGINLLPVKRDNIVPEHVRQVKWLKDYLYYVFDTVKNTSFADYATDRNKEYYIDKNGGNGIRGRVLDNNNEPIIGAMLEIQKAGVTVAGAVADEEGEFISNLVPGTYNVVVKYVGFNTYRLSNVVVTQGRHTVANIVMQLNQKELQEVVVTSYKVPLIGYDERRTMTSEEIEKMPTRSTSNVVAQSAGVYQSRDGALSIGGSRDDGTVYIIDGIKVYGSRGTNLVQGSIDQIDVLNSGLAEKIGNGNGGVMFSRKGGKDAVRNYMDNFVANMIAASGMRKDFKDWAIWEPNLWTNDDGNATFTVRYPDNVTAWKTYVLAMNQKQFAGRVMHITKAFKPLAAELAAPKFLRYGDTVEVVGKVMNYLQKPYEVKTSFVHDTTVVAKEIMTVNNAKVQTFTVAAPVNNSYDTGNVLLQYSMALDNGFTDGEHRELPVYPVGVTENHGDFVYMAHDTTIFSKPEEKYGRFTGEAKVYINSSLLDVMMDEVRNLKEYPYGCTEQLTTKLLSIYYEEEVKRLLKDTALNNTKTKRAILEKLIAAQNKDGSFGWWRDNAADYRITNYVLSTMLKINKDGWLDFIIRRGLWHLDANLGKMDVYNRVASMSTLSAAGYASNYRLYIDDIDASKLNDYNKIAIAKICKEQKLPYRNLLDSIALHVRKTRDGAYIGLDNYDWYRNDLATTLLYYQVVKDDSVYGKLKDELIHYVLFRRSNGYYRNTAESGLVLTTLLPELMKDIKLSGGKMKKTEVAVTGALNDTIRKFPAYFTVKNNAPRFRFDKKGIDPAYVSVVYSYFNLQPQAKEDVFNVKTFFVNNRDTIKALKQGEKATLKVSVTTTKETEYVMITVPIPAGCIQVDKNTRNSYESNRENYRDRTLIFCGTLPKGTFNFDIPIQARYKGKFNLSPAKAEMMYYPDEYGNTPVKKIEVK